MLADGGKPHVILPGFDSTLEVQKPQMFHYSIKYLIELANYKRKNKYVIFYSGKNGRKQLSNACNRMPRQSCSALSSTFRKSWVLTVDYPGLPTNSQVTK